MKRVITLLYGLISYLVTLLTMAYCVAFFGNLFFERTIDAAAAVPFSEALLVNLGLLTLFGLQHSGMARKPFKRWLRQYIDRSLERSTYVLASSIALIVVILLWQPMGVVVWAINNDAATKAIYALYFAGWGLMIAATFMMDHLQLFGLRQVLATYHGSADRRTEFRTPALYRHVRHPIYLGWLLIMWAAPVMTLAHLVFAAGMTIYMLFGIQLEERDLVAELPDYQQYKRKVPMLLPSLRKRLLEEPDA